MKANELPQLLNLINLKLLRYAKQLTFSPEKIAVLNVEENVLSQLKKTYPHAELFTAITQDFSVESIDLIIMNLANQSPTDAETLITTANKILSRKGLLLFATFDHDSVWKLENTHFINDNEAANIINQIKLWQFTAFKEHVYVSEFTQAVIDCDIFFVTKAKIFHYLKKIFQIDETEIAFEATPRKKDQEAEQSSEPKDQDDEEDEDDENEISETEKEEDTETPETLELEKEGWVENEELAKEEFIEEDNEWHESESAELITEEELTHEVEFENAETEFSETNAEEETNEANEIETEEKEQNEEPEEEEEEEIEEGSEEEPSEKEDEIELHEEAEKPEIELTEKAQEHLEAIEQHHDTLHEQAHQLDTHMHNSAEILTALTTQKLSPPQRQAKITELKQYRDLHAALLNQYNATQQAHKNLISQFIERHASELDNKIKDNYHQILLKHALKAEEHKDFLNQYPQGENPETKY